MQKSQSRKSRSIITRFAPSPSGDLHLGSLRTALFNFLHAKKHGGKFLLRIEDTDQKRSKKEYVNSILNDLKFFSLHWNEKEIFQSERTLLYLKVAKKIFEAGNAYFCECEKFVLKSCCRKKKLQKGVLRFALPEKGIIKFHDQVQKEIQVDFAHLNDFTLVRSDGAPTYNLCAVVDDHETKITDVIRGSDHLTNTFKQILIYQSMNWEPPLWGHIPLIHDQENKKLSKRNLCDMQFYKKEFLPEAVLNYLMRLGWSYGNKEFFTLEEAIKLFDIRKVSSSSAKFDLDKLKHLNQKHMLEKQNMSEIVLKQMQNECLQTKARIKIGLKSLIKRCKTLSEIEDISQIYKTDLVFNCNFSNEEKKILKFYIEEIKLLEGKNFKQDILRQKMLESSDKLKIDFAKIARCTGTALTGMLNTPNIFEMMDLLGKEISLKRILNSVK